MDLASPPPGRGYDRAGDSNKIIIMDGKWSEIPGKTEDPFTREEREKRERVDKNANRQQKNLQNAVATHGKGVLPPTLQMSAAPRKGVKALPLNGMKKQQINDLTAHVARSTASIGKYNAPVPGDERIKTRGKRRQFDSVTDMGKEKSNSMGFIDKLMRREKDFTVDVNVAARGNRPFIAHSLFFHSPTLSSRRRDSSVSSVAFSRISRISRISRHPPSDLKSPACLRAFE